MNPFLKKETNHDLEIFTIYDSKSQSYREPTYAKNKFVIMRELEQLYRDKSQINNQLVTNAEDFSLFKIGEYWLKNGQIESCKPTHIANMHEIKASLQDRALNPT